MQAVLPFPDISPEVFSVTLFGMEFALRWYALAYIVGLLLAWRISLHALARPHLWADDTPPMTKAQVEDLMTWIILGVILGGRLGFVLFYQPGYYLSHPAEIPMVWQGGMSFHGGFLGVVVASWLYTRAQGIAPLAAGDAIALGVPVGLMLGRIANFINGELWGRPSDAPWAVIFPHPAAQDCPGVIAGACARHPSQLYEAALEGVILLGVLLWLAYRRGALKVPGQIMGVFVAGYGVARFIVEYFRQADEQFITEANPMGYVIGTAEIGLTMGQILSLPMVAIGVALIVYARARARHGA